MHQSSCTTARGAPPQTRSARGAHPGTDDVTAYWEQREEERRERLEASKDAEERAAEAETADEIERLGEGGMTRVEPDEEKNDGGS